jgi:hypothetical protein
LFVAAPICCRVLAVLLLWMLQPPPGMRPITPGVGDPTPLSIDPAVQPIQLRMDAGFDRLYRIDPSLKLFGGMPAFARRSGAITAIFPQSTYAFTREGVVTTVPPGAVFQIDDGRSRPGDTRPPDALAFVRADLSAGVRDAPGAPPDARAASEPVRREARPAATETETIWTSERERVRRLEALFAAAR